MYSYCVLSYSWGNNNFHFLVLNCKSSVATIMGSIFFIFTPVNVNAKFPTKQAESDSPKDLSMSILNMNVPMESAVNVCGQCKQLFKIFKSQGPFIRLVLSPVNNTHLFKISPLNYSCINHIRFVSENFCLISKGRDSQSHFSTTIHSSFYYLGQYCKKSLNLSYQTPIMQLTQNSAVPLRNVCCKTRLKIAFRKCKTVLS